MYRRTQKDKETRRQWLRVLDLHVLLALASKARELEIFCNARTLLGCMIRARLAALRDNNRTPNFLQRNIIELAKYGYFFRPTNNSFHTDLITDRARRDTSTPNAPRPRSPGSVTSAWTPSRTLSPNLSYSGGKPPPPPR